MRTLTPLLAAASLALALPSSARAQAYEGSPCTTANPALKKQLAAGKVPSLANGITSEWAPWSTSFLKAEGRAPPRRQLGPDDDLQEGVFQADVWSCQHTAQALVDKDPATAWADGAPGDGVGEVVAAPVDVSSPVWIWGGLGHSPRLFAANARPRQVRVWLLSTRKVEAGQSNTVLLDLAVVGKREVELKDLNDYQPLPLPELAGAPDPEARFVVALEILSVYKGGKYADLCISEIGNEKAERPKPAVKAPPLKAPAPLRK